jgi:hypothetical protein
LERLITGRPLGSVEQELTLLADVGQVMRDASICGLGQTAASAIASAITTLSTTGGADGSIWPATTTGRAQAQTDPGTVGTEDDR